MDIALPYSFPMLLGYGLLYLAVVCLWLPSPTLIRSFWLIPAASVGLLAFISGQLDLFALMLAVLYLLTAYQFSQATGTTKKVTMGMLIACFSVLLGAHILPGFHNLKVLDTVLVSTDGLPFTMYLNLDKTLVALGLLGWCIPRLSTRQKWRQALHFLRSRSLILLAPIFILALASGKIHWDPKLPSYTWLWTLTNLLFVCTAEEAFFRGFLQRQLFLLWQNRPLQKLLPLVLASFFYGLSHLAGGPLYVSFVFLAGLAYGWVYQKSDCIEASILLHFGLNLTHFLLFTYPSLP